MTDLQNLSVLPIALVQAELIWADPDANRASLSDLMDRAPDAALYVLPETFTTGFLGDRGLADEAEDGPTMKWLRNQALRRHAAICGSHVVTVNGERRNRLVFVDEQGKLRGHYDKRHLFGPGGEGDAYVSGENPSVIEWRGWRIDLQICYDLRFPVWCRNDRHFDLQLFVANWPTPRVSHWQALLRARAIENQAFVIGVNRTGIDGNQIEYPGSSMAFDAMGQELIDLGEDEEVSVVELDLEGLQALRSTLPYLQDADRFERHD